MPNENEPVVETPGNPTSTPPEPGARESMENPGNPVTTPPEPGAGESMETPGNPPAGTP